MSSKLWYSFPPDALSTTVAATVLYPDIAPALVKLFAPSGSEPEGTL